MIKISINKIKNNPSNPRIIKDEKYKKLVKSLREFPQMLEKRPLICCTSEDGNYYVLGGNMRLKACKEVGIAEVPILLADDWTEEQKNEFIVKDNVSYGEWDWDVLANQWDADNLEDWGLDVPNFASDVDYSILDDQDVSNQLSEMSDGIKKAIQIEFEVEHYKEAWELVKFWREQKLYIGGFLMEKLKDEKAKL